MMLRGTSKIVTITLALGILFSSSVFASDTSVPTPVKPKKIDYIPFVSNGISGAITTDGSQYFAVDGKTPVIYQITGLETSQPVLKLYKDLSKDIQNFYSYFASHKVNRNYKNIRFEGITYCSGSFYLANQATGDIVQVKSNMMNKLEIEYGNLKEETQANEGFVGITADCNRGKLYVVKQKYPNTIFGIDFVRKEAMQVYDMSKGVDSTEYNISDLSFVNGELNILQKNQMKVLVMDPSKAGTDSIVDDAALIREINYSEAVRSVSVGATEDEIKGIAEGLIVRSGGIYLFLNKRNWQPATADKSKDVIVDLKI